MERATWHINLDSRSSRSSLRCGNLNGQKRLTYETSAKAPLPPSLKRLTQLACPKASTMATEGVNEEGKINIKTRVTILSSLATPTRKAFGRLMETLLTVDSHRAASLVRKAVAPLVQASATLSQHCSTPRELVATRVTHLLSATATWMRRAD